MKKVALIGISLIFVYYLFFHKKKVESKDKVIIEPKNVKQPTETDVIGGNLVTGCRRHHHRIGQINSSNGDGLGGGYGACVSTEPGQGSG